MIGPTMFRAYLLSGLFMLVSVSVQGQRPTMDMLKQETLYVEATRARLLGNEEEAITKLKQILESDDENDVVYYELTKAYLSTKANKDALEAIKKAIKLQPQNVWYNEELAAAHAANDDFIAAADVYQGLIQQRPREQKFYYDLAFYLIKNNNIKKAIDIFQQHEKLFGVSEEVIGRKFNLYKTLGDQLKAENELVKLVKAYPTETNYAIGLAKFYEDTNNQSKAKSTYQKILKSDPNNVDVQVAINKLNGGKSKSNDNSTWSDTNVNIDVKISKIISAINGLPNASKEKQDEIIAITNQITAAHPKEAKAFAVHGDVLNFSGRSIEAISAYESALDIEKNIYSVWDQLLQLYAEVDDMSALYEKSEQALDYFPNESKVYYLNGLSANELGKYSDAMNSLMQADIMSRSNADLNADIKAEIEKAKSGMGKKNK